MEYSELIVMFKKPVWDDLSFVAWCIILLEVGSSPWFISPSVRSLLFLPSLSFSSSVIFWFLCCVGFFLVVFFSHFYLRFLLIFSINILATHYLTAAVPHLGPLHHIRQKHGKHDILTHFKANNTLWQKVNTNWAVLCMQASAARRALTFKQLKLNNHFTRTWPTQENMLLSSSPTSQREGTHLWGQ